MKQSATSLLAALLIGVTGCASVPDVGKAGGLRGQIVAVADGDTATLLDADRQQHRIRLDGIDAPEKAQPFGDRSRQSLRDLAHGRDAVAYCSKVDRYERQVCRVTVDGLDVGLEQVRRGMAWHFKRYESEQRPEDGRAYAAAEIEAREQRRGLWRDPAPAAPWDWRAAKRGGAN